MCYGSLISQTDLIYNVHTNVPRNTSISLIDVAGVCALYYKAQTPAILCWHSASGGELNYVSSYIAMHCRYTVLLHVINNTVTVYLRHWQILYTIMSISWQSTPCQ